ncbi:MAG: transposase family protein [Oligoflexia bacterium]|nr:transposase family protein [Oligoflexia bacterium]
MKLPTPTHRERVALFRQGVIGDLLARDLERGELLAALQLRAQRRYRPPGAVTSRRYSYKTLQRWYYDAKRNPAALLPASRTRGFALALSDEQRDLLVQMRAEHRSAPIDQLLAEAHRHGIIMEGQVSISTLTRLFRDAGLTRLSRRVAQRKADVQRRRWQARNPGDLWHGDVCHLILADPQGDTRKVLVHGFMDDASRHFTALVARASETERDMLEVLCGALLQHPPPAVLYLDNGACYRGDVLALVCQRLEIRLVHARPYSPESRGKMERVWRTMRQRCTDHLAPLSTLHDVDVALWAWLDADYHARPHASLMGESPRQRYRRGGRGRALTPTELAKALEVHLRRRVKKDATFSVESVLYEVTGRHLCGKTIDLVCDGLTDKLLRATYQEKPVRFGLCDAVANRSRGRAAKAKEAERSDIPFDPITSLLQAAREVGDV